jgi:hypothetical protein
VVWRAEQDRTRAVKARDWLRRAARTSEAMRLVSPFFKPGGEAAR